MNGAAGDELRDLAAEVDDEDLVVVMLGHGHPLVWARRRVTGRRGAAGGRAEQDGALNGTLMPSS